MLTNSSFSSIVLFELTGSLRRLFYLLHIEELFIDYKCSLCERLSSSDVKAIGPLETSA